MGCKKITYEREEGLEQSVVFLSGRLGKKGLADKKRRDYYPYGSVAKEWKNEDFDDRYRFQYQGQFAEKDDETGWNHFELRELDTKVGRWLVVDPMRQYSSPYNGNGNNPISNVDPTGGENPIHGSDGKFRGYDSKGYGGEIIVYDGEFSAGMDQNSILQNGGVWSSSFVGEILFAPSIPRKFDMNSSDLSMDDFINWGFYINGTGGKAPDGTQINLSDMVSTALEDNRPWYNKILDWGAMNGANTLDRRIKLDNGSYVTFLIVDPNFKPPAKSWINDVSRASYDEDLIPQSLIWFNVKFQTSAVMRAKFSDRQTFINYVNILGQ